MAINSLRRRVIRLETASGEIGSFERRLRRLAGRLAFDPDRLVLLAKGHQSALSPNIDDDGLITWAALCQLHEILAGATQ